MLTHSIKTIAKKAGFTISRNNFGLDRWDDTVTILGRNPDIIFDVGANIGQTALALIDRFPEARIHCFEPFPKTFDTLQRSVAPYSNIVARQFGMAAEPSRQSLHYHANSEWNSVLKVAEEIKRFPDSGNWSVSHDAATVEVEFSTVDQYCSDNQVNQIDVLKTDTQGYELAVLTGARAMLQSKRIRMVIMEINFVTLYDGQCSFEDLYRYMNSVGYQLSGLYDRSFCQNRAIMCCDGLFVA